MICKFVAHTVSEPVLIRKYSTGGMSNAAPDDQLGDTGDAPKSYGEGATYRVVQQRNVQAGPVMPSYTQPDHENNTFFASTPSGQLQLFSVMNMNDLRAHSEIRMTLEYDVPDPE